MCVMVILLYVKNVLLKYILSKITEDTQTEFIF